MHGNSHPILQNEITNQFKVRPEEFLPVKGVNWVRGERNKIRSYSEEEDAMFEIESQDFQQAFEVPPHGLLETFFRVGFQSEGLVATT